MIDNNLNIIKTPNEVLLTMKNKTQNVSEWAREYNISPKTLMGRIKSGWSEKDLFLPSTRTNRRAKLNNNYFDIISDEHQAYWLGFLWSDGYLGYRIRDNGREEYNLKLSLMESDYKHLEKFNNDLNGEYNVHFYDMNKGAFRTEQKEARLFITNKHLGMILRNKYGIIPHREDFTKIEENVPQELIKHLIRGIVDADGSFTKYYTLDQEKIREKYSITICGTETTLRFIERHLIESCLINNVERKLQKRHKEAERDKGCYTLYFSGKKNVLDILDYLYKGSTIYLDRKYKKYLNINGGDIDCNIN